MNAVVREAESWLGTPYHHAADVKGAGVDCAMLLVRVFCDLGLVAPFDPRPYPHDWMLHRSEERFLGIVERMGMQTEERAPGRVALFRFGRCVSHGAILAEPGYMIHANLRSRSVVKTEVAPYETRLHSIWSVNGV